MIKSEEDLIEAILLNIEKKYSPEKEDTDYPCYPDEERALAVVYEYLGFQQTNGYTSIFRPHFNLKIYSEALWEIGLKDLSDDLKKLINENGEDFLKNQIKENYNLEEVHEKEEELRQKYINESNRFDAGGVDDLEAMVQYMKNKKIIEKYMDNEILMWLESRRPDLL